MCGQQHQQIDSSFLMEAIAKMEADARKPSPPLVVSPQAYEAITGRSISQVQQQKALRPTVEITKGTFGRVTLWGWECSCEDGKVPWTRKDVALAEAREHFDTKHGGSHGREGK